MRYFLLVSLFGISLAAQAVNYSARYTVPAPEHLKAYAQFDLHNSSTIVSGDDVTVVYRLPAELVGEEHPAIVLSGKKANEEGKSILSGEYGEALCVTVGNETNCQVRYENLEAIPSDVDRVLVNRSLTIEELTLRREVAQLFSGEPIGIIEIVR